MNPTNPARFVVPLSLLVCLSCASQKAAIPHADTAVADSVVGIGIRDQVYVYGGMNFQSGQIAGLKMTGPYSAYYYATDGQPVTVPAAPVKGSFCFLTTTYEHSGESFWSCSVGTSSNNWTVTAQSYAVGPRNEVYCAALCITGMPFDPSAAPPPNPTLPAPKPIAEAK